VDPGSGSGFCQIKDSLLPSETVTGVSTPEPKCHPIPAGRRALRDLISAVDHLATGEAHELKLTLTAFMPLHSPLSGSSRLESLFARSVKGSKHLLIVVF
tara:strand:- start:940 stop:1239 length:300 start_codon:yes stop_codon:yes gene_type:complete